MLLTGGRPLFLTAYLIAGQGWRCAFTTSRPGPTATKSLPRSSAHT